MKMKKYFVTCDLEKTLAWWVSWLTTTTTDISSNIRDSLKNVFNDVFGKNSLELITYQKIKQYFQESKKENEFIISLEDGIYIDDADFYFSSSRTYDNLDSILNAPNSYQILQRNWKNLGLQKEDLLLQVWLSKGKEIVLCDDWLFSWDTLKDVINILKSTNVKIKEIRVILNFTWKSDLNWIPIKSMYKNNTCIDWLDERDLFYWTKNWWASFFYKRWINGLAYISSKEIASKKASIPEKKSEWFCKNILDLNIQAWWQFLKEVKLENLPRIEYLQEEYDKKNSIKSILEDFKDNL